GLPAGGDESVEDFVVAGADGIFRVPLHAEAEAIAGVLDSLDDAVLGDGIHHHVLADALGRLVVGAVYRQAVGAADAVQQGAGGHRHHVAGLGARVGLFVGERTVDLVG